MKYSESNKPIVCMMTQSTCYKGTTTMTPKGVLWHSTGANNTTLKRYVQPDDNAPDRDEMLALIGINQYNNDFNHINRQAGLNAWVGKLASGEIASIQTMPWNYKPWGCGSGPKGSCNNGWMQFEICEDSLNNKSYFDAVYHEACELTAYYCKMYGLNPKGTVKYNGVDVPVILDHATSYKLGLGGNHGDVQHWFKRYGKTLDDVRNDVAALMTEDMPAPSKPTVTPAPTVEEMYRVRKSWADSKSQIGAYRNLDNAKKACNEAGAEYKVYNSKGEQVYPEVKVKPDASKINTSAIDEKKMWDYFLKSGMNEYGVAGVMGNLYAESGLRPANLQNSYEKSLGMTDAEYTVAVDAGTYTNFVKDSAGYGLAQWTYWSLKQDMLAYHQKKGKSIGDGDVQMEFLVYQLSTQFAAVWKILTTAKSVREASDAMLLKFERPADQSEAMQKKRAEYGQKYYDKFATKISTPEPEKPTQNTQPSKPTLRVGSQGEEVRYLQKKMGELGFDCKGLDGIYGANTKLAVEAFQRERNLSPDGVCGPLTWAEIDAFAPYEVTITATVLNVRFGPGTNYIAKSQLRKGAKATLVYKKSNWGKIKNGAGWICLDYAK